MRDMKYHIINKETSEPLTWDDKALEFDSEEEAQKVLDYLKVAEPRIVDAEAEVKKCILFYDGGYINFKDIIWDWDCYN